MTPNKIVPFQTPEPDPFSPEAREREHSRMPKGQQTSGQPSTPSARVVGARSQV